MQEWKRQNSFCNVSVINDSGCSIITSRIGGGWVSAFFVMLRDEWYFMKGGEWYYMKGDNVTVKKVKAFFVLLKRSGFHWFS